MYFCTVPDDMLGHNCSSLKKFLKRALHLGGILLLQFQILQCSGFAEEYAFHLDVDIIPL